MPHLREETLNTYLALLLDKNDGISATPKMRSSKEAVDITVKHDVVASPVPILIEAKIGKTLVKRREAAKQARKRLTARTRSIAYGLCYPPHLRDGSVSAQATQKALAESTIAFAPVRLFGGEPTWREGTVSDLADSLRNTDLSRQLVADSIEYTVREVADMLFRDGCTPELAAALALPKRKEDLRAASLVAALMLSNAALLHQRLRLVPALKGVSLLEEAQIDPDKAPSVIRAAWEAILDIDFHPVFSPALAVLSALEDKNAKEPLRWIIDEAISLADELASLRFDHAGPLYHRLLASARYDGSFYTNHVSVVLLARLALSEESANWSNVDSLANLKIIDPACGTGTLLMAAMHTIRDRHEKAMGPQDNSDVLHLSLVEDVLFGLDVNRHGVQLAACNLTLGNPRVDYSRMNLFTMRHGPQTGGRAMAGSLEFLVTAQKQGTITSFVAPLPTTGDLGAEQVEAGAGSTLPMTNQFDVVIMNPPFTRNDIRNRQYSSADRRALQEREIEIAEFLATQDRSASAAIDQTGVRTFFTPLADLLLKQSCASFASVVPTTALTSASGIPERKFLADRFQIETIVTSHDPNRINFSENTDIHESLLIARRPHDERGPARFISLARMPVDSHEAILLSDLINRNEGLGDWGTEHLWPWPRMRSGDWRAAQFYDGSLATALHDLEALAGTVLTPAGLLCHIEPGGQRVRDAFVRQPPPDAPWTAPTLWDHSTKFQNTMNAQAETLSAPKQGHVDYAKYLFGKASQLLVVNRLRTNTVRVTACYASQPLLGSSWVPVRPFAPNPDLEHALCAWWNSTPGILTFLNCRAKGLDYARFALASLRSLLVPDPGRVDISPLADAFRMSRTDLIEPWPRLGDCQVRAVLDQAAAQVLRIDGRTIAGWRRSIAREPTVSGKSRARRT